MLGILNVASFVELVREGTVLYDPVSGALTAADKVSARRIRVKEVPLASDPEKLRKLLFESLLITAAYRASRALGTTLTLTADQTYLEQRGPDEAAGSRGPLPCADRARALRRARTGPAARPPTPSSVRRRSSSRTASAPPPAMRCSWTLTARRTRWSTTRTSGAGRSSR